MPQLQSVKAVGFFFFSFFFFFLFFAKLGQSCPFPKGIFLAMLSQEL